MSIKALPVEILDVIFSHLDLLTAVHVREVCKVWNQLARTDRVLEIVCQRTGFLKPGQTLEEFRTPVPRKEGEPLTFAHLHPQPVLDGRPVEDLESYEAFIRSSWLLQQAWPVSNLPWEAREDLSKPNKHLPTHTRTPAVARVYNSASHPRHVHNLIGAMYDHVEDCFISRCSCEPGFSVTCARSGELLFSDQTVRHIYYLEYSHGWLVQSDFMGHIFHIWRFERIIEGIAHPRRGFLRKYGFLQARYDVSTCRFRFPHLAVGSRKGHVTVFDIPAQRTIQDVRIRPSHLLWYYHNLSMDGIEFDEDIFIGLFSVSIDRRCSRMSIIGVYDSDFTSLVCSIDATHLCEYAQEIYDKQPYNIRRSPHGALDWVASTILVRPQLKGPQYGGRMRLTELQYDEATKALLILGPDHLFVIPDYLCVFSAAARESDRRCPELSSAGIVALRMDRLVYDYNAQLAVADGRAAFFTDYGVTVVDIRSLLARQKDSPLGQHSSFRFNQEILCHKPSLFLQMDATSLTVACWGLISTAEDSVTLQDSSSSSMEASREGESPGAAAEERLQMEQDFDRGVEKKQHLVVFNFRELSNARHALGKSNSTDEAGAGSIRGYPGACVLRGRNAIGPIDDAPEDLSAFLDGSVSDEGEEEGQVEMDEEEDEGKGDQ